MPEDITDGLNEAYNEILGIGGSSQDDSEKSSSKVADDAYADEDYTDDSGDGVDPRDQDDAKDKDVDNADNQDDSNTEDDSEDNADLDDDDTEDDDGEEIPHRLVDAGRRANLSDDDIVELAETKPHVLESIARSQENTYGQDDKLGVTKEERLDSKSDEDKESKQLAIDIAKEIEDDPEFSPTAKKVIQQLAQHVDKLTESVGTHEQSFDAIQKRANAEGTRQIDTFFDSKSVDVPVLGKADQLSQENIDARVKAHKIALGALKTIEGISEEEALAIGVNALKGQMTDSQVRKRLVSDLKRQKKRFTARPKGRRQSGQKRGSKSTEQRGLDAIDRILDSEEY